MTVTSTGSQAAEGQQLTVGFMGLGIMGIAMARNLLKCGAFKRVMVWNRTLSKVRQSLG